MESDVDELLVLVLVLERILCWVDDSDGKKLVFFTSAEEACVGLDDNDDWLVWIWKAWVLLRAVPANSIASVDLENIMMVIISL